MSELVVRNLKKSFGNTEVLKGLNLDVAKGEILAALGPSGSGKTTLLRAVAGFEEIDEGSISVDGRVMDDARHFVSPENRGVAIVPQDQALFPHLTVAQNIGFGVARARRKSRIDEMLEFSGLGRLGDRMPHQLSGGQQQRVALARALAPSPALVLLDEPFTGLDSALRASIRENIANLLRQSGATVILVTHDQTEALSIADKVAVLHQGQIVQTGSPTELYSAPINPWVGTFVGEANLLDGEVSNGRVQCVLGNLATQQPTDDGPVHALIRPENVSLTKDGTAQVVDHQYYGHDAMVIIRLDNGELLRARVHGELPERSSRVGLVVKDPVLCFKKSEQ